MAAAAPVSIPQLIGLPTPSTSKPTRVSLATTSRVDPDDYPELAIAARELGTDIRSAYADALGVKEREEREQDQYFLERARDYVELNEQVETSTALLTDLSSFLSTFQHDLSAVSGHISELQGRSRTIEGRLESRKAVERSLHPLLSSIVISPSLVQIIVDTEVDDSWIPAVTELDAKLGAIRSGPRLESRKTLDEAAESLRVKAAQKILVYLVSLLKPFSLSVAPSLPTLQTTSLLPLKPLFDFLRRHAARQAHEFQKAYVSTIRWYYETGFRRYVRGLEKVRLRSLERVEALGVVVPGSESALALLSKKNHVASGGSAGGDPVSSPLDHSQLDGPGVVLAFMASDKTFRPSPEALFRSASLVLMDNAETEHAFISTFFGQHSTLPVLPISSSSSPTLFSEPSTGTPSEASFRAPSIREPSALDRDRRSSVDGDSVFGSESGRSVGGTPATKQERGEKLRKAVVDGIWKSILEPAQEYVRNFAEAILDPAPPSPVSLLAMIRLNEGVIDNLVTSSACPPMENHLIGLRLLLWPVFAKVMTVQIESVRKINGTLPSGGVFGGKNTNVEVKDSAVQVVGMRYTELFNACVALSGEQDEEMVFSSLMRLRHELDNLFTNQAEKMADPAKHSAFLSTHYEEMLQGLSAGLSRHPRSQSEVAHWRELARRLR